MVARDLRSLSRPDNPKAMANLIEDASRVARSSRRASQASARQVFTLDGACIVLDSPASHGGVPPLAALAEQWHEYHSTVVIAVANDVSEWTITELGRAAQAFDRIVVCEAAASGSSTEAAGRLARAVRCAGRTECHVVSDPQHALRHCIDALAPGAVIVYCCDDVASAARILADYGAAPIRDAQPVPTNAVTGTTGALIGSARASAAARA
ncbi:MAG: hypothetical protein JWO70_1693 [Betaproteobacteria bacterium]|nr:hypothetical protein [Betaproteobacteria bacterium]